MRGYRKPAGGKQEIAVVLRNYQKTCYFNKNLKNGTEALNGDFEILAQINAAMEFLNWHRVFSFIKKVGNTAPQHPYFVP